ncbi:GerMN domain-containing protein [Tumebacillus permanentifrigoris]|uniref:Sporulation and spore germination protein n=1 Tax=Tumebacillus permanentifrigoris TaxID=378543 RepID=A0A316DCJ1_9BACL|nr:GerMN domain-containing protein [Tumebacillus permanentifrigoris]PWK15694.1 sporulation and spore germination protein [Tumebacillus permanentifrigoris]
MKKTILPILLATITTTALLTGCGTDTSTTTKPGAVTPTPAPAPETTPPPKQEIPDRDTQQVTVYRADQNATKLVKETETTAKMASETKFASVLFDMLKKSNPTSHTIAPVPPKVELIGVTLEQGTLTLNFNDEVTRLQGSATETIFVDAVNKTMFDDLTSVTTIKYQINGQPAEVLTQLVVKDGFHR